MPAKIYKYDLYGKRQAKLTFLESHKLSEVNWQELPENNDVWRLEGKGKGKYMQGFSVTEIFIQYTAGFVSAKDSLNIAFAKEEMIKHIRDLQELDEFSFRVQYNAPKDSRDWKYKNAKEDSLFIDENKLTKVSYRPFDTRWTYYTGNSRGLYSSPQKKIMQHFLKGENIGLIANRQVKAGDEWQHVFVTSGIVESSLISNKTGEIGSAFPLYLYDDFGGKIANLKKEIWEEIEKRVKNSPLESLVQFGSPERCECPKGWQLQTDGVDSYNKTNSKIEEWDTNSKLAKSTSPAIAGTPQRGELDTSKSKIPLVEGWQSQTDGVDSTPTWQQNSLFPFWNLPKNKELEPNAKKLRKAGVLSEVLFWQAFNNKKLLGFDIDRQVIIGNYIVDFFIPEIGLVIEIDGESHDFKGEYDQQRELYLQNLGLEVIHYKDAEIKKSMGLVSDSFLAMIKNRVKWLKQNPPRQPSVATPQEGNLDTTPEDILDYIYGYLHLPTYRSEFAEFLKTDFPRVPYPRTKEEFFGFVEFGKKLRDLHLMTSPEVENFITTFPVGGSCEVESVKYVLDKENTPSNSANLPPLKRGISGESSIDIYNVGKVWINSTQYFGNVPEASWNFYIGGYQPAQKYLKDRKGSVLNNYEIEQYQRIIKVLCETAKVMQEMEVRLSVKQN